MTIERPQGIVRSFWRAPVASVAAMACALPGPCTAFDDATLSPPDAADEAAARPDASTGIARIQVASNDASTALTVAALFKNPTTLGDVVVAVISANAPSGGPAPALAVADNVGSTYAQAASLEEASGQTLAVFCATLAAPSPGHGVTATVSSPANLTMIVHEYRGITCEVDGSAKQYREASQYSSGPATTTHGSDLLLGAHYSNNRGSIVFTPLAPWTSIETKTAASGETLETQERITAVAAAYASEGTADAVVPYSVMVAFPSR